MLWNQSLNLLNANVYSLGGNIMSNLKTISIHGKSYVEVNQRIKYFRENYPEGSLITELVSNDNGMCVFKATAIIEDKARSTGWAYEKEGSSNINKTSYIENCETSALGRCLGNLGIGIDGSVASAEEVQTAILQQEELETKVGQYLAQISECIGESDDAGAVELWREINNKIVSDGVWKSFTSSEKVYLKEALNNTPV